MSAAILTDADIAAARACGASVPPLPVEALSALIRIIGPGYMAGRGAEWAPVPREVIRGKQAWETRQVRAVETLHAARAGTVREAEAAAAIAKLLNMPTAKASDLVAAALQVKPDTEPAA